MYSSPQVWARQQLKESSFLFGTLSEHSLSHPCSMLNVNALGLGIGFRKDKEGDKPRRRRFDLGGIFWLESRLRVGACAFGDRALDR